LKRIRITADEEIRKSRGWVFTEGIDDGATECNLDHITDWDLVVDNNDAEGKSVDCALDEIMKWINTAGIPISK
jgi:phosphomevalonate kinase